MRKRLGCLLAAMLLVLMHMHVALAGEGPNAGRIREDALTNDQLLDGTGTVLGSSIARADIGKIEFSDSLECTPGGAWDVSETGDGSVMAWEKDGVLTIAANGRVKAPRNARGMFANYANATEIRFNGCLDTSDTEDMYGMFIGCGALQALDLEGFNTSSVTNMGFMFNHCGQLKALDVSGFDTSRVKDMNTMFQSCTSLEELDVSGFDTSNVTALDYMFYNCPKLKTLDISDFDTQRVKTLDHMFCNCDALQRVRVSRRFLVGSCVNTDDMFTRTNAVIERDGVTMTPEEWLSSDLTKRLPASLNWPRLREDAPSSEQFGNHAGTVLGSEIQRSDIRSIEFLNSLECAPEESWDVSQSGDGSVMAWVKDGKLTIAGNGGVRAPESANLLFSNYTNVTSIRFNGCFDTYETYNMASMFYGCSALQTLDFDGFDTSGVTDMAFMFSNCSQLKALDVSGFDTSRVKDMNTMFQSCTSLETLDVSGFDTSGVTAMDYMFYNCPKLKTLDVSGFDTHSVTTLKRMFYNCAALEEIRMGRGFVVADGADTGDMFTKTTATIVRDGAHMTPQAWLNGDAATGSEETGESECAEPSLQTDPAMTQSNAALVSQPGERRLRSDALDNARLSDVSGTVLGSDINRDEVTRIEFRSSVEGAPEHAWDASEAGDKSVLAWFSDGTLTIAADGGVLAPEDGRGLFANYTKVTSIQFNDSFDTSETTNMYAMFSMDSSLKELDVSWMNTSSVTNMFAMFNACSSLASLNISGFDTHSVEDMGGMFYNCGKLEALDVSGFDTSNVTDMNGMFRSCGKLKALDVSGFDTSGVIEMTNMFYGCERLEELDLSGFNTAGVTSMSNMFCRCSALKRIVFTELDLSNVTDMQYAFSECESLEELRVGDDSPANRPNIAVTGIFDQSPRVAVHSHGSILTPDEWLGNETAEPQTVRDADKIPNDQTVSHVERERSTVAEQMPDPSTAPAPETWSAPVPEKWPVPEPEPAQDEVRAGDDAGSAPRMRGEALTMEELENRKGTVLGSDISRDEVQYITFADSLEAAPSGAWDVSEAGDGSVMAWISNGELTVTGRGGVKAPGNATGLFANYTSLRGVSFNGCFLTTETADMSYMFYGDEQLMELDCAGFDTFRVQSMRAMFCGCSGLEALDVSGFITDNVMDMSDMFNGCSRLKALDVSRFATGKVAGMRSMFNGCSRLEALNVSGFDTKQVRDMGFMFRGCEDIESLNLAGFDTTNVSDMQSMFAECRSLTELDLSRFNTGSVGNFSRMFMECTRLDKLLVSDAFVALGDPFPENGDMVTRGPLQIQNGDDVIDAEQWQQNMRIDSGLHKGDKGTSVKWIQRVLTKLSYLDGKIDGVFGTKTQNALMEFQGKCGLESSGVADDGTLKALARQVLE